MQAKQFAVLGHPLFLPGKALGLGNGSRNFVHDGYSANGSGRGVGVELDTGLGCD